MSALRHQDVRVQPLVKGVAIIFLCCKGSSFPTQLLSNMWGGTWGMCIARDSPTSFLRWFWCSLLA